MKNPKTIKKIIMIHLKKKYKKLQLLNKNNGCHQDTFIKMMEEVSRRINFINFIKSDIEKKINFCLTKTNESVNKSFRDSWKKNTEKMELINTKA